MTPVGEFSTAQHLMYLEARCEQVSREIGKLDELARMRMRVVAQHGGDALNDLCFCALTTAITLMREKHKELDRLRVDLGGEAKTS